jgi:hypothetical protein
MIVDFYAGTIAPPSSTIADGGLGSIVSAGECFLAYPFVLPDSAQIDSLVFECAGSASFGVPPNQFSVGLYDSTKTLVMSKVVTLAVGLNYATFTLVTLAEGNYWLGVIEDFGSGGASSGYRIGNTTSTALQGVINAVDVQQGGIGPGGTVTTLPASFTTLTAPTTGLNLPVIRFWYSAGF